MIDVIGGVFMPQLRILAVSALLLAGGLALPGAAAAAPLVEGDETPRSLSTDDWLGDSVTDLDRADEAGRILGVLRRGEVERARVLARRALDAGAASAPLYEVLGAAAALAGDLDAAERAFEAALEHDPAQATALTKLGDLARAQGRAEAAARYYRRAVEADPTERRAHQRLGLIAERRGDVEAAVDHFEKGLRGTPPSYVGIKTNLARLYNRTGAPERTLELLGGLVDVDSRTPAAMAALATAHLATGDAPRALALLRAANALTGDDSLRLPLAIAEREAGDPRRARTVLSELAAAAGAAPEVHVQLAKTHLALDDTAAAARVLEKAVPADAAPGELPFLRGRLFVEAGAYGAAVPHLEDAVAVEPAAVEPYLLLARARQRLGAFDAAAAVLEDAVARFPRVPAAHHALGRHFGLTRAYDRAVAAFERGLDVHPGDPALLEGLCGARLRGGAPEAAAAACREMLTAYEERERAAPAGSWLLAGFTFEASGSTDAAIEAYRTVVARDGEHWLARNNLGVLLVEGGEPADGLRHLARAAELAPDVPAVLDSYGWALLQAGAAADAVRYLEKAVAARPNAAETWFHLAEAQLALGDHGAARGSLEHAFEVDGEFASTDAARALLDRLD